MHKLPPARPQPASFLYRLAATALVTITALALLALAHHPVGRATTSAHASMAHLASLATPDRLVHGALILAFAILAACHAVFAISLGAARPPVWLALAAYLAGCCLLTAAMLLDGFVMPQLAQRFVAAPEAQAMQAYVVISAISVVIQVATKAGLLAICLALVAFACALASGTPRVRAARGVAALALLAGLVPAGFLLFADAWLAPPSLMALFGAQAVWHAGIAWTLFTHRPDRSPAALPPHAYSPVDAQS